jgi:hypothetical protein
MPVVLAMGKIGDWLDLAPINSTAIAQLNHGNTADAELFARQIGFQPRSFDAALRASPANVQDRWHAQLYWLRLALRFGLALFWLASGLIGLAGGSSITASLLPSVGPSAASVLAFIASLIDVGIGAGLLLNVRPRFLIALQVALIIGYPLLLSGLMPSLWLDPFGPLIKNLPLLLAVLCHAALLDDR